MAIEQFAESLLADVRQQNRDRQKDRERDQRRALLASIGTKVLTGVGNKLLAQKTQDFINSTEFKGATQVARVADNNIADFQAEWNRIETSKQDPMEYLMNRYKPIVEQKMKADTEKWREDGDDFENVLFKRTQEIAREQLDVLRRARSIYEDKGLDQNMIRLETMAKNNRPASVEDYITGKLVGFFSGKTREDLEREEILALRDFTDSQTEGTRGYYAKKLKLLKEQYDRSGDLLSSKIYSENMMLDEPKPGEQYLTVPKSKITVVGDRAFVHRWEETYDPKGPGKLEMPVRATDPKQVSNEDLRSEAQLVALAMESYDRRRYMQDNFEGPVLGLVEAQLAESKILVGAIDTKEEFNEYERILKPFLTNPQNYKDNKKDIFLKAAAEKMFESEDIFTFLNAESENYEEELNKFLLRVGGGYRSIINEASKSGSFVRSTGQ